MYEHSAKMSKPPNKLKNVFKHIFVFVIDLPDALKNTNQHVNRHAKVETNVELLSLPREHKNNNLEFFLLDDFQLESCFSFFKPRDSIMFVDL